MKQLALIACGLLGATCFAESHQETLRPKLGMKAIVGATVQMSPTKVLQGATILIKGNVIVGVGTDIKVPAGTEILDGKGLTVYAGFIDAYTTKGQVADPDRPRQDITPDTGVDVVTQMRLGTSMIRADRTGADLFNPDDEAWRTERSGGFTAALVAPSTGIILGQPSLIAIDGNPRRLSTIVPSAGVSIRFRGGGGFGGGGGARVYPGTPLGYYATARQALFDAAQWASITKTYAAGNAQRPPDDSALAILAKPMPFLLQANTMPEIDRTLDFGAEFSRPTYIVGGAEGYKITSKLKSGAKGAILTLDFGAEPIPQTVAPTDGFFPEDSTKEVEAESGAGQAPTQVPGQTAPGQGRRAQGQTQGQGQRQPGQGAPGGGGRRRGAANDPDEPLGKKKEDEALWLEKVKNAAALEKAGVPFALSTEGAANTDEFFTNLRRAVKEGLSKPGALAALTSTPAQIFGVGRIVGTIEVGKIANLTILTSDLFMDGAKVKYLFIDGAKIDPSKASVEFPTFPRFGEEE